MVARAKRIDYLLTRRGATNVWEKPIAEGPPHPDHEPYFGPHFWLFWNHDGKNLLLAKGEDSSDVARISNFR